MQEKQAWPLLVSDAAGSPASTVSMLASSRMMEADLPPSSRLTGRSSLPQTSAIERPAAVERPALTRAVGEQECGLPRYAPVRDVTHNSQ